MDKSAITQIQEAGSLPEIIKQVANTGTPVAVIPDSMCIKDLEYYMKTASRFRLQYKTNNIDEFVAYINEYEQQNASVCFVDAEHMAAKAIIDLGTEDVPLHKQHAANLILTSLSIFKKIIEINGSHLSQKQAAEFIEEWGIDSSAIETNSGGKLNPLDAANRIRKLTIEAARTVSSHISDFSENMSAIEKIEAKNSGELPVKITFISSPYSGFPEIEMNLRLSIITSDDKPKIAMRIIRLETLQEKIADDFKEIIHSGVQIPVFIGNAD